MRIRYKKKLAISTAFILILSFFIKARATTIDDTTISVSEGQIYNWTYTYAEEMFNASDRVKVTIDHLYRGNYSSEMVAILNATIEYYNSYNTSWEIVASNEIFMCFNETTDFIYYAGAFEIILGWLFFVPIPLDLPLIGDYLNVTLFGNFESIVTIGNQLLMQDYDENINLNYLFNDDGILTEYNVLNGSVPILTLEFTGLTSPGDGDEISFGHTFLLIMIVSVVIAIPLTKNKFKSK